MRVIVVVFVFLFWSLPALAEVKAPDGFGPIKFGMTKEEAWEAIGGAGRWAPGEEYFDHGTGVEYLVHKVGLPRFLNNNYEVRHRFADGRAGSANIVSAERNIPFDLCMIKVSRILGILARKYEVEPIRTSFELTEKRPPRLESTDIYHFQFHDSSSIQVYVRKILEDSYGEWEQVDCKVYVIYAPPQEDSIGGF